MLQIMIVLLLLMFFMSVPADVSGEHDVKWLMGEMLDDEFITLFDTENAGPAEFSGALKAYAGGDFRTAALILEKIRELALPDGNLDFVCFALAESYRMLGLQRMALEQYHFVIDKHRGGSKEIPSYFRVLQYACKDRDVNAADSFFVLFQQHFSKHPLYSSVLYETGKLYFREDRYAEGYQILALIPRSSARYMQAQFLASLCHAGLKEWEKALFLLEFVRKNATDEAMRNEAAIIIGDIYMLQNNLDAALQFYAAVPAGATRYQAVQVKIARAYLDLEQYEKTRSIAKSFIDKNPENEYVFEMASILEMAYRGLGDGKNAERTKNRIYRQLANTRLGFEVMDELDNIAAVRKSWQLIDFEGIRKGDDRLRAEAGSSIARVKNIEKQYSRMLEQLGMGNVIRDARSVAGIGARRYVSLLRDTLAAIVDSINVIMGEIERGGLRTAADSPAGRPADCLDDLRRRRAACEHEIELVVNQCLVPKEADERTGDIERHAQFIDWTFEQYLDKKKELAERSRALVKRRQPDDAPDSVGPEDVTVVELFSAIDRDKLTESLVRDRHRVISHIESLLNVYPKGTYNAQLLMRLAELYYDEASDDFNAELNAYEKRLAAGDSPDSLEFPEYSLDKVLFVYEKISEDYPRDPIADDAMFYQALALQKQGQFDDATNLFLELTAKYPESEYFVEANMRIGRYYFERPTIENRTGYDLAEAAFRKVLYYRDHPQFVQALYYLGWCYYMKDQFPEAISVFKYLVEEVELDFDPGRMDENQVINPLLRDEAIDYIAISFDEDGKIDEAIKFLKLVGNIDYASMVMKRIGELRVEDMDYDVAVKVYNRLFDEYPFSSGAPAASLNLMILYEGMNRIDEALKERERFFATYCAGSEWRKNVKTADSSFLTWVDSIAVSIGLYVGDEYYRQAEKSKNRNDYTRAVESYARTVGVYADNITAAEARWNLAVILETKLDDKPAAYGNYLHFSRMEGADIVRREQAALNAIALAQQLLPRDTLVDAGSMGDAAVRLIEAVDNYSNLFPRGVKRAAVMLAQASVFFNRAMFGNAAKIYETIIAMDTAAASPEYYPAQFLLGQCRFGEENWLAAAERFEIVWKGSRIDTERNDAYKMLLQSRFLAAKQLADGQNHAEAAAAYLAIEDTYPGSEYCDIVLFNAAGAFEKQEQWLDACKTYKRLVRVYPRSKLAPDALFNAAGNYEKIERFDDVAAAYEQLIANYTDSDKARDALFNLGLCYEKLGKLEKLADVNERYSRLYPGEKDVEVMLLRSAGYYYKAQMHDKAAAIFGNFISRFPDKLQSVEALYMIGKIRQERGMPAQACEYYIEAEKKHQDFIKTGSEGNAYFAAEAAFALGNIYRDRFSSVVFSLPQAKFREQQKQKTGELVEAVKAYERVVKYRSERIFEAAYRIGGLYEDYAWAWHAQPREKLDEIKKAVVEKEISTATASLLQKSIIPYRKVMEIAAGFDSLGTEQQAWVDTARTRCAANYHRIGQVMSDGATAMLNAPVPPEIRKKPVHFFQYRKQVLEAIEPLKIEIRDYYRAAFGELEELNLSEEEKNRCRDRFCEFNYRIGGDYDGLALEILSKGGDLPAGLDEDEREDMLFQIEDIVFELQDKAIFAYEDAMNRARKEKVQNSEWYDKIMESLARLAPEAYGQSFYHTIVFKTDRQWIARCDSVEQWYGAMPPEDGWFGARPIDGKRTMAFPAGTADVIGLDTLCGDDIFLWKHVFVDGVPRGGAVYVATPDQYRLYVNGSLLLKDTTGGRSIERIDSAAGITSLLAGGDNVVACAVTRSDSAPARVAILVSVMADTTRRFESVITLPEVAREPDSETDSSAVAAESGAPVESSAAEKPPAVTFRGKGDMRKTTEEFENREKQANQELRKERLEFQKLQIMSNELDLRIRETQDEVGKFRELLDEMDRGK